MSKDTDEFDVEKDGIPLDSDDVAVILKPILNKNNEWTQSVDVSALLMPTKNLVKDETDQLTDIAFALIACFNLLNTDIDFADRVNLEMDEMSKSGEVDNLINNKNTSADESISNVYHISKWTKTEGNA